MARGINLRLYCFSEESPLQKQKFEYR